MVEVMVGEEEDDLHEVQYHQKFWNELGRALEDCPVSLTPRSASPSHIWDHSSSSSSLGTEEEDHAGLKRLRLQEVEKPSKPPTKKKKKHCSDHERSRKSSSTYRGVSLCTKDSRWQARIRIKKEVVYLGRFESEEAAARRYDDAAREHHGDKALLNFVTQEDRQVGRKCVFEQVGGKSARV